MTGTYALRDSTTMLRRNLRHLQRYPGLSLFPILMPVDSPAAVRLRLRRHARQRNHHRWGPCRLHRLPHPGDAAVHGRRRRPDHRNLRGQGHGRGHHRPLQDDADLATRGAGRPCLQQPDPDSDQPRGDHRRRAADRLSPRCRPAPVAGRCRAARTARHRADLAVGRARPDRQERRDREQLPMFLILLPFLGSGFVPVASMPAGLRWFAENQPFTPITNTVRSLLANQHVGSAGPKAIVWCLAITAAELSVGPVPLQPPTRPVAGLSRPHPAGVRAA